MKHFLSLEDLGPTALPRLLDAADYFKQQRGEAEHANLLRGKSIALVFEKASTRTRLSLQVAVSELGGHPVVITSASSQLGRGEPIADTARVLSRMVHAITFRTYSHASLLELASHSSVPVLNALTDTGHPMQLLADLQTVRREFGRLEGLKYVWVGDGNNMACSWIEAAGLLGLELSVCTPEAFAPPASLVEAANRSGARVSLERDPARACAGAHVVNTDVFASMGQEAQANERLKVFAPYIVSAELMARAASDAIVLHCLPAHRGEEIAADVLDGPQSRVWDQAEARLHTSKAVLCWALGISVQ